MAGHTTRICLMYSYKGGAGRTVATANIASILAKEHEKKVVCIDLDVEGAGLGVVFNVHKEISSSEERKCLQDVLCSRGFKSPQDFSRNWWPNLHFDIGRHAKVPELTDKLFLIPSRFGSHDSVPLGEDVFMLIERLLSEVKAHIKPDYILLDSASGMGDMASAGFSVSEILLVFMRWSRQFMEGTIETIKFLQESRKVHTVLDNILIVPSAVPSVEGESDRYDRILKSNKARIEIETDANKKNANIRLIEGMREATGLKWEEKVLNIQQTLENDEVKVLQDFRRVAETILELK